MRGQWMMNAIWLWWRRKSDSRPDHNDLRSTHLETQFTGFTASVSAAVTEVDIIRRCATYLGEVCLPHMGYFSEVLDWFLMTHKNSWQPTSTPGFQCWPVLWCWLHLLFREKRCCSFTFRVRLEHEPHCYCWQKSFQSASAFQENRRCA